MSPTPEGEQACEELADPPHEGRDGLNHAFAEGVSTPHPLSVAADCRLSRREKSCTTGGTPPQVRRLTRSSGRSPRLCRRWRGGRTCLPSSNRAGRFLGERERVADD